MFRIASVVDLHLVKHSGIGRAAVLVGGYSKVRAAFTRVVGTWHVLLDLFLSSLEACEETFSQLQVRLWRGTGLVALAIGFDADCREECVGKVNSR